MAMIKCPECGSEISSNAKRCVKCGCEITCCPECYAVYAGEVKVCTNCGYAFSKQSMGNSESTLEVQTKKIEQQVVKDSKTLKTTAIVERGIEIVSSIALILTFVLYFTWAKKDALEKIAEMKDLYNNLIIMSVVSITLLLLSFTFEGFVENYLQMRRNNWLQNQKFDYKTYILKYNAYGIDGNTANEHLNSIKYSAFMIENPGEKFKALFRVIIKLILLIIADICACVWVTDNLKKLFAVKFISFEQAYKWQFNSLPFIIAIIAIGMTIIIWIISLFFYEYRFAKWYASFEDKNKN